MKVDVTLERDRRGPVQVVHRKHVPEGAPATMKVSGTAYTVHNIHDTPHGPQATLRRAVPKPQGKAARRAAKKARREGWLK